MRSRSDPARCEWVDLVVHRRLQALAYPLTLARKSGFVAYTYALRHLPVSFVSLYAYINPVIAVALGVVVLGEPFDRRIAIAAVLVLAGVAIVRWKPGAPAYVAPEFSQASPAARPSSR